jgi:hypothetical protein
MSSNIRFYKYFFIGMKKPITMEAFDKLTADKMLNKLSVLSRTNIDLKNLIDVRIETPLFGITTKKRESKEYVWVGIDKTSDGWILQEEYDKLEKLKQQEKK